MGIDQVLVWYRHCSCNNKQPLTWIFVYPNNALDCLLMSASSCQAFPFVICISWPRISSRSTEGIVYGKYVYVIKGHRNQHVQFAAISTFHRYFRHSWLPALSWYLLFTTMTCFDITFFHDFLPSWLKRFVAIPSNSDQPYTSASPKDSSLEGGSGSPASHRSPVNSLTGYVPGITVLPSPPPTYLSTISKPTVHGYQECEPFSFNQTPPIPKKKATSFDNNMERFPALNKPPVFFSSTLGMYTAY